MAALRKITPVDMAIESLERTRDDLNLRLQELYALQDQGSKPKKKKGYKPLDWKKMVKEKGITR